MCEGQLQAQPESMRLGVEDARGRWHPGRTGEGAATGPASGAAQDGGGPSVPRSVPPRSADR
eukprot:6251925-Prorocentrum_lima.AAC.1